MMHNLALWSRANESLGHATQAKPESNREKFRAGVNFQHIQYHIKEKEPP